MGQRKPYNPNTKYGRKKLREEYYQKYENMNADEKSEHNNLTFILMLIAIVVFGGIAYLIGGPEALLSWLSH